MRPFATVTLAPFGPVFCTTLLCADYLQCCCRLTFCYEYNGNEVWMQTAVRNCRCKWHQVIQRFSAMLCHSYTTTHICVVSHSLGVSLCLHGILFFECIHVPQSNASVLERLPSSTRWKDRCSSVSDPIQWL